MWLWQVVQMAGNGWQGNRQSNSIPDINPNIITGANMRLHCSGNVDSTNCSSSSLGLMLLSKLLEPSCHSWSRAPLA